jgi:hypothetical protein
VGAAEEVGAVPERGAPNLTRPRLPEADEKRLEPLDQQGARAYSAIEVGLEMIRNLFGVGVDTSGIPVVAVVASVSDTAVTRISVAAQTKLREG